MIEDEDEELEELWVVDKDAEHNADNVVRVLGGPLDGGFIMVPPVWSTGITYRRGRIDYIYEYAVRSDAHPDDPHRKKARFIYDRGVPNGQLKGKRKKGGA